MQKWEYLTMTAERLDWSDESQVTKINYVGVEKRPPQPPASKDYPDIWQWLSVLGNDGWEAVSVQTVQNQGGSWAVHEYLFKRPKE